MRVLIAGGSGMIGRRLVQSLRDRGDEVVILSRNADALRRRRDMWPYQIIAGDPTAPGRWQDEVDGCNAVVNLVGHNIFANRWNTEVKRKIRDSRVYGAEQITAAIRQARARPTVLVQGSAIGFYGIKGDETIDESAPSGADFLAVVCREMEEATLPVESAGVRRVMVRTGIVLGHNEGALKLMTPLFKIGPGVPIGSAGGFLARGQQWMSWIHIDDIVGIFVLALDHAQASGPMNGTAPEPVKNADFAKTFSGVLRTRFTPWRAFVPVGPPDAVLRAMLGEVAGVIATGQRVVPAKALALGYTFKYPHLEDALREVSTPRRPEPPLPPAAHAGHGAAHH
jgi:uncharacterized protein (TIGR01777 family)